MNKKMEFYNSNSGVTAFHAFSVVFVFVVIVVVAVVIVFFMMLNVVFFLWDVFLDWPFVNPMHFWA